MTEDVEDSKELDRIKFAPRVATKEEYSHAHAFQDLDGRVGLSYWQYRFDVRPSLSFQVYVIYEASTQHEDMVALAESLYKEIYPKDEYMPLRLDIHFMGAVTLSEAADACTSHYRAAKQTHSGNQAMRLVPSYGRSEEDWHGFLITVPRADWRENGGLGLIYFDRVGNPATVDPEGEELPDPWHVYPTRQIHSGEPVEQQDFSFDVPDDDNLWTNDISQVYITIADREEWEDSFYKEHSEARDRWAREELARRKAKKKAEEEADDEVKKEQPSQE